MSIAWESFTPWASLAGGVMVGLAAALYRLGSGLVAGGVPDPAKGAGPSRSVRPLSSEPRVRLLHANVWRRRRPREARHAL